MDFLTGAISSKYGISTGIGLGIGRKIFNVMSDPLGIEELNMSPTRTNNTQIIYVNTNESDGESDDETNIIEKKVNAMSTCKYRYTNGINKGNICGRVCILDSYCNEHEKRTQIRLQNSDRTGLPLKPKKISYYKNKFSNYEIKNNGNSMIPRFLFDMTSKKIYGIQNNDGTCGALTNKHINICKAWNIEYRSIEETISNIIEQGNY